MTSYIYILLYIIVYSQKSLKFFFPKTLRNQKQIKKWNLLHTAISYFPKFRKFFPFCSRVKLKKNWSGKLNNVSFKIPLVVCSINLYTLHNFLRQTERNRRSIIAKDIVKKFISHVEKSLRTPIEISFAQYLELHQSNFIDFLFNTLHFIGRLLQSLTEIGRYVF